MRILVWLGLAMTAACTFDYGTLNGKVVAGDGAADTSVSSFDGPGTSGAGGSPGGEVGAGGRDASGVVVDVALPPADAVDAPGAGGAPGVDAGAGGIGGRGGAAGSGGAALGGSLGIDGAAGAGGSPVGSGGLAAGGAGGTGGTVGSGGSLGAGGVAGGSGAGGTNAKGGVSGTGGGAGTGGNFGTGGTATGPLFTELLPSGFIRSEANAVSADGTYVSGSATVSGGYIHAIRWTNSTFEDLGTDVGWVGAYGKGISDDGAIVVGFVDTAAGALAFRWDGQIHELPPLVSGGLYAQALGVSGDGKVVFGTSTDPASNNVPVRWVNGGIQQLPLVTGQVTATPGGISYDGAVIAGTGIVTASGDYDAVRWPANGVSSLGIARSQVFAVSGDGRFILGAHVPTTGTGPQASVAFRWSAAGTEDLPAFGTVPVTCQPVATTSDGAIVAGVCSDLVGGAAHPYLWSKATGDVSLDSLLLQLGVDTSRYAGFTLADISADGTTIVGNTTRNGVGLGFRAVIASVFP